MTTDNPFYIKRVLDSNDVEELMDQYNSRELVDSTVYDGGDIGQRSTRRSKQVAMCDFTFPDICSKVRELVSLYGRDPSLYSAKESNLLHYGVGGKFKRHTDRIEGLAPRMFSTITLLNKTEDLVGGDLVVDDTIAPLNVGETLIMKAITPHEVTKITKGERWTMVTWIYNDW